ncbi:MAG TPA: DUF721 domain-containing protein [Acidobacteriota bacterium]|mgnify:CR=1 FL=1|nr:DUF721 domain-containing protein [Acidobacteriota bacterium]
MVRGMKSLGQSVQELLVESAQDSEARLQVLQAYWSTVVGDAMASATSPTSLRDGVLLLSVDELWAQVCREEAGRLIGRVNGFFRGEVVRRLELRLRH